MLHGLANLGIGHVRVADDVEALHEVAVAELQVGGDDRGVAVDAHRRRRELLALGEGLVVEHVGVAAPLAVVRGEGVSRPDGLQARVLLELRARHDRARIGLGRRVRHGLAAAVLGALHVDRAQVEVVLHREVLAPDGRVVDGVVQLDHAVERVSRFLLALEDVDEQCGDGDGGERCQRDDQREHAAALLAVESGMSVMFAFLQERDEE